MKKKTFSLLLSFAILVTCLSGCVAQELDIHLEPDGSGEATVTLLLMDDFLAMSDQTPEEAFSELQEGATLVHRTIDGIAYTGAQATGDFTDAIDFNLKVAGGKTGDGDPAALRMLQEVRNGETLMTLYTRVEDAEEVAKTTQGMNPGTPVPEDPDTAAPEIPEDPEDLEALASIFRLNISMTFPQGVKSVTDLPEECYTIDGNSVSVAVDAVSMPQSFAITGVLGKADVQPALDNIKTLREYQGQFKDVPADAWYLPALSSVYGKGIVDGTGKEAYSPSRPLTRAQIVVMAARAHAMYQGNDPEAPIFPQLPDTPWYSGFVDYAIQNGIVDADTFSDYSLPATRGEMALVLSRSLPEDLLKAINPAPAFTDVPADHPCAAAISALYTAGVANGKTANTFAPDAGVTRAQAVVFLNRLLDPAARVTVSQ